MKKPIALLTMLILLLPVTVRAGQGSSETEPNDSLKRCNTIG
jgi:hypothetical protein